MQDHDHRRPFLDQLCCYCGCDKSAGLRSLLSC
jgi:hypothetical protein